MHDREIIDVHCHFFNAQYLAMELVAITWNRLWGDYPHQKRMIREREEGRRAILPKLKDIQMFAAWIARLTEAGLADCEGSYQIELRDFADSTLGKSRPLLVAPLMMDIYYALDDNRDESGDGRRERRAAAITEPFAVPANQTSAFEKHVDYIKGLVAEEMQKLPATKRRRSTTNQTLDVLFEKTRSELIDTSARLRRGPDEYSGIELSPGYKKHMHDLEKLCEKYPGRIFPFLAVDPRRIGIMKLIEMKVNKGEGAFKGIKLYPPLGYLPSHPNLEPVFNYCALYDIPITVHCSKGGIANFERENYVRSWDGNDHWERFGDEEVDVKGSNRKGAYYAAPKHWRTVLARWPTLRVNFAHFGGSGQFLGEGGQNAFEWLEDITRFVGMYPRVYTDISYFGEAGLADKISGIMAGNASLPSRIMFGTDYVLVMLRMRQGVGLTQYFEQFSGLDDRLLKDNAKDFLKL